MNYEKMVLRFPNGFVTTKDFWDDYNKIYHELTVEAANTYFFMNVASDENGVVTDAELEREVAAVSEVFNALRGHVTLDPREFLKTVNMCEVFNVYAKDGVIQTLQEHYDGRRLDS